MEDDTFQHHCKQWFGQLLTLNDTLLDSLFQAFQTQQEMGPKQMYQPHQVVEDSLLKSQGQVTEFFGNLKPLEENVEEQLRQNSWEKSCNLVSKDKIDNSKTLLELAGQDAFEKKWESLPLEHPCKNQIRMALELFRSMLYIATKYWQDYEKVTLGCSEMIIGMGKVLSLHYRRSLINSFVLSMQKCFQEMLQTKIPKQLQRVHDSQLELANGQKELYQKALSTFDTDVLHLQQLIRMLATIPFETSRLAAISKKLTELSLLVKGWIIKETPTSETSEMKIFPILEDVHKGLVTTLNDTSLWMVNYLTDKDNSQKEENSIKPLVKDVDISGAISAASMAVHKNKSKSHVALLLQYVDRMHTKEKEDSVSLANALSKLSSAQASLQSQIIHHTEKQKKNFDQCTDTKQYIHSQQIIDPLLAKKLLALDHTLETFKMQRQLIQQKLFEKKLRHSCTQQNVATLQHVLHFLKLWEQRDDKWRQMIRREIILVSAWKNLRFMYFHRLHDLQRKWHSVSKMELSTLTLSNQLMTQDMIRQVHDFQRFQWTLLQEKNKQLFRHISLLSLMFQRVVRQTSMLCPGESRQLVDHFQRIETLLATLESYWNLRYQKDLMQSFRKNATFFYALVTLLIRENRDPLTDLHKYSLVRQQMEQVLTKQQDQAAKLSLPSLDTDKEFQANMIKLFSQFGVPPTK